MLRSKLRLTVPIPCLLNDRGKTNWHNHGRVIISLKLNAKGTEPMRRIDELHLEHPFMVTGMLNVQLNVSGTARIREIVKDNPDLIGQREEICLPASSDIDILIKEVVRSYSLQMSGIFR